MIETRDNPTTTRALEARPISGPSVLVAETSSGPRTFRLAPNPRAAACAVTVEPGKPITLALSAGALLLAHVELDPARAIEIGEALAAAGRARGASASAEPWGRWPQAWGAA